MGTRRQSKWPVFFTQISEHHPTPSSTLPFICLTTGTAALASQRSDYALGSALPLPRRLVGALQCSAFHGYGLYVSVLGLGFLCKCLSPSVPGSHVTFLLTLCLSSGLHLCRWGVPQIQPCAFFGPQPGSV